MTEDEKVRALVAYRLEQADEALRSAETNLEHDMERSAVNRAYYAMFYAVLALLATRKKETSRHSGALSLFDREFVKAGVFSKDLSRWLHEAFNLRQSADYGTRFTPSSAAVRDLVTKARTFVSGVRGHLATAPTNDEVGSS